MAQTGTPVVRDGMLHLPAGQPIRVGSATWFGWLAQVTLFSYQLSPGSYRLTFRKEKRRHRCYWYAYLKNEGKLHNAYAGRSATLTADRLQQLSRQLLEKVRDGPSSPKSSSS